MMNGKRIAAQILWASLGGILLVLGYFQLVDPFWSGMGVALIVVGVMRLIRAYRFSKDASYREKVEIEIGDERNRYLRGKAWAWAGYLFILITAVAVIVLKVVGQELLSIAAGGAICLMLVLYWGAYLLLRKKY
jgi:hypothetical protein